jgi:predicted phosphoadenosine phosphosulfate sulfurtransferase
MPKGKKYLDTDVVTAAKERIEHIYDIFDNVVLMYSGGKDSSVVLELCKQFHEENGLGPVEAVFRDGETLPFSNIKFLEEIRKEPWINLRWQCFNRVDDRYILGTFKYHTRWDDTDRPLTRPMPEWAETSDTLGLKPGTIIGPGGIDMDDLTAEKYKGSVAFLTGIRASESLVRFRSVVNKLNENYICRIEGNPRSRVRMVKPIYDWEENDVLKYLKDTEFPLCEFYDAQEMVGSPLRVGPPLGLSSKRIGWLREIEPEFYEAILESFPDMAIQDRYWEDFDLDEKVAKYAKDGFRGVMRYIEENIPPGYTRDKAVKRYRMYKAMHDIRPEEFPPDHLLKVTMSGVSERKVRGIDPNSKANREKRKK